MCPEALCTWSRAAGPSPSRGQEAFLLQRAAGCCCSHALWPLVKHFLCLSFSFSFCRQLRQLSKRCLPLLSALCWRWGGQEANGVGMPGAVAGQLCSAPRLNDSRPLNRELPSKANLYWQTPEQPRMRNTKLLVHGSAFSKVIKFCLIVWH